MDKLIYENETLIRPINFLSIFSILEEKIEDLAQFTVSNYVCEGIEDGKNLLTSMSDDLARWTQLLTDRRITTMDFETLVIGSKDWVEMDALIFAGLALARVDQFKGSVLNLIIDTVFSTIKI